MSKFLLTSVTQPGVSISRNLQEGRNVLLYEIYHCLIIVISTIEISLARK